MTLIVGGMFLLGFIGLPILRAVALMITGVLAAVRSIEGWINIRSLGAEPNRPLFVEGLTPGLAALTRHTRYLNLELRRFAEQSPTWTKAASEGTQTWWSALVGAGGFQGHTEATREAWEWVRAYELLPETDRARASGLGVQPQPIRELLAADVGRAEQVRTLTGLISSFDERLAELQPMGYRGANTCHARSPSRPTRSPAFTHDDDDYIPNRHQRWHEVLNQHSRGISRIAASHAHSAAEREDLEQDISLALWQALPEFRGDSSLRTFVYRIARYCCFRLLRRRGRIAVDTFDDEIGDPTVCLDTMLHRADKHIQLEQALARLPEGPRSTLALRLEGKSYAEIAEILGISERNVSVRLVRARKRIATELRAAA